MKSCEELSYRAERADVLYNVALVIIHVSSAGWAMTLSPVATEEEGERT